MSNNDVMNDRIRAAAGVVPGNVVKVYVRRGDSDDQRTIAFRIPDGIPVTELLERGATIDGNQAVLAAGFDPDLTQGEELGPRTAVFSCPDLNDSGSGEHRAPSLVRVLGDCQRSLMKYLRSHGYEVEFA